MLRQLHGSVVKFRDELGNAIRSSIDIVIDTPKTNRRTVIELEKTEKTYLGTRVEIELRALLKAPKGKLDMVLGGHDVDVKFTIGSNWMIPREAINEVCILIAADEPLERLYVGLILAKPEHLTGGANRDGKKSVSAEGFKNIRWLVQGEPYPANFWKSVPPAQVEEIFEGRSGNERIASLFTLVQQTPIPRSVIADVAKQQDFMKRVRTNGGARDQLSTRGIVVLHGKTDGPLIRLLSLPTCTADDFISKTLTDPAEKILARRLGHVVS